MDNHGEGPGRLYGQYIVKTVNRGQSVLEADYIRAMSRTRIVNAYAKWSAFSDAERLCFERFLPKRARILDLGCGAGRAVSALPEDRVSYLGVDASKPMISRARQKHPQTSFAVGDIVEFTSTPCSFDAILLLHNVIDMLNPKSRRIALLRKSRTHLARDGILIASSHLLGRRHITGYCQEDYHGTVIYNYRSSLPEWCAEVESVGFLVLLAMRDVRGSASDWAYLAARKI